MCSPAPLYGTNLGRGLTVILPDAEAGSEGGTGAGGHFLGRSDPVDAGVRPERPASGTPPLHAVFTTDTPLCSYTHSTPNPTLLNFL